MKEVKEYSKKKLVGYLEPGMVVGLFFWHGLGDLLMFLNPFHRLKQMFPRVLFDLILQKGVGQEAVYPDAILVSNEEELQKLKHDIIFHVHFPMSEFEKPLITKPEKCCRDELGIPKVHGHRTFIPRNHTPIVGLSFNVTALPDSGGVPGVVASKVWNEVKKLGYMPLEIMMEHTYHNAKNSKFKFVDNTLRGMKPNVATLAREIGNCYAFIGTSSGPIHVALSMMSPEYIGYFERDLPVGSITKEPVRIFDVKNYTDGSVEEWLSTLLL